MKSTKTKRVARKAATKKRRSNKAPSAKQLAARRAFAKAAALRAKNAKKKRAGASSKRTVRPGKKAAPRKRNKTVIVKPKRVLVLNPKKRSKKRAKRRNSAQASPATKALREKFVGKASRKTTVLKAPKGTPVNLAKLGKLVLIKTEKQTIKPPSQGTTWLCADAKGKLHIATSVPYDGPTGNFGQVLQVEYEASKPHVGYPKPTIFFHTMGEEGGKRPTLTADREGLRFRGGAYKIKREGIVN